MMTCSSLIRETPQISVPAQNLRYRAFTGARLFSDGRDKTVLP